MAQRTPSQTVGPYLHIALAPATYNVREIFTNVVAEPGGPGTHVRIAGRLYDGDGAPLSDALIEIWQADHQGCYAHPADGRPLSSNSFRGFGRFATLEDGGFRFTTVKPGSVAGPDGTTQAPHINVGIFARGILKRLFTRIYFEGEPANASDPVLALVPSERRATLMARPDPNDRGLYRFDVRLQGADETVFFDA